MSPDDPATPDTFQCDGCGQFRDRDAMHDLVDRGGNPLAFCDDCVAVPF